MAKKARKDRSEQSSEVGSFAQSRGFLSANALEGQQNLFFRTPVNLPSDLSFVGTDPVLSSAGSSSVTTTTITDRFNEHRNMERLAEVATIDKDLKRDAVTAYVLNTMKGEKEVVEDHPSASSKSSIVEAGSGNNIPATVALVTTVGTSSDVNDRLFSEISENTRGEPIDRERSTGLIIKPNRRATLSLSTVSGRPINIAIREFFITGVREDTSEKFQIVQTFGSDYIFFFNRKPLIYTINGVFYNSEDKQWRNDFKYNYDSLFRGTQLVKSRNKAIFAYDDVVRHGYLLNLSYSTDGNNPHAVPFSFSMFVIKESRIGQTPGREGEDRFEQIRDDEFPDFELDDGQ